MTIYLDHNGTTPVDPQVTLAIMPYLHEHFGNPSSSHIYGRSGKSAVTLARAQVAELLGANPSEIVFTSGASESNSWVMQATVLGASRPHLITTRIEHPSVLKAARVWEGLGLCSLTVVGVDRYGMVSPEDIRAALRPETKLVSVMHANNEVGTIQPIAEIAAIVKKHGALLHVDAAQSVGKIAVRVDDLGADLLSVAGHKFYAPKGIGALYIRSGLNLDPMVHGAGHENGRRSGTESVPLLAGLGKAAELCARLPSSVLRDHLQQLLIDRLGDRVVVNGHPTQRLPNTLSLNFRGVTGAELLGACPGLAASTGPACHDGVVRLSHVLEAIGVPLELGKGTVRLSLGRQNTAAEIEQAVQELSTAYLSLTANSSLQSEGIASASRSADR